MGRASRRKRDLRSSWRRRRRESRESAESRVFREHLQLEDQLEGTIEQAISDLRKAGYRLEVFDITALCRLAKLIAIMMVDGEKVPVIEDLGTWADAASFDHQMFEAGLFKYIRRPLPGDKVPEGAPQVVLVC
jgi:hypothetical protein